MALSPNHLLSLDELIGLTLVDDSLEYEQGYVTIAEVEDIARREGFNKVKFKKADIMLYSADYVADRVNIIIDKTNEIITFNQG